MKHLFVILLGLLFTMTLSAQTFTESLERVEAGKGRVIIHQNPVIERLVNAANASAGLQGEEQVTVLKRKETASGMEISGEDKMAKTNRPKSVAVGYRIQVYSGGNSRAAREQAMHKGNLVKKYFVDVPVYTHFYSPRWTCRVGDFKTYEEAKLALEELKSTNAFSEAVIVKCKIQVFE